MTSYNTRLWALLCAAVLVGGLCSLSQAAWIHGYTEDFESCTTGNLNGQNGWVAIEETGVGVTDASSTRVLGMRGWNGAGKYRNSSVADVQDVKMSARILIEETDLYDASQYYDFYVRANSDFSEFVKVQVKRGWDSGTNSYTFKCYVRTEDGSLCTVKALEKNKGPIDLTLEFTVIGDQLDATLSYTGGSVLKTFSQALDAAHVVAGATGVGLSKVYDGDCEWIGEYYIDDVTMDYVPEPTTLALLGAGMAGFLRRRRG